MNDPTARDRFLVSEVLRHAGVVSDVVSEGKAKFLDPANDRSRYAVQHATELIAEAAEKGSPPFQSANPGVPWAPLRPLRRGVAHPYDLGAEPVNKDELWHLAAVDLPRLARPLRRPKWVVARASRPGE